MLAYRQKVTEQADLDAVESEREQLKAEEAEYENEMTAIISELETVTLAINQERYSRRILGLTLFVTALCIGSTLSLLIT